MSASYPEEHSTSKTYHHRLMCGYSVIFIQLIVEQQLNDIHVTVKKKMGRSAFLDIMEW
jgi:hypothetical protein